MNPGKFFGDNDKISSFCFLGAKLHNISVMTSSLLFLLGNAIASFTNFSKSDIILLPYTKITQSGVLEMALQFEKPILTSNLDYFRNILNQFPSFGFNTNTTNVKEFTNKIIELSKKSQLPILKKDIETYYSEKEYNLFITNFKSKLI